MRFFLFVIVVLVAISHATAVAFPENRAESCAVQVSISFPDSARASTQLLKEKAVDLVEETYDEFIKCSQPRYVASSCHTSFVQGVRRGGCYMDMMFFCQGADSSALKCRALDTSELIGTKIKLEKRQRAILTDMAITKSTIEDEILQY